MEIIGSLIFWAYLLGGVIVVPIATLLIVNLKNEPVGRAGAFSFVAWYLGAPIAFFVTV
jgi:hypothetical protein